MVEQFDRLSKYSLDSDNKKMYEVRKEQWENVSKEYERGYIDNNSQRIGTNKIDLDYINSKDYADKYMKISKDTPAPYIHLRMYLFTFHNIIA